MNGWISLHRKIKDNWLWKEKPFSKGQAWIDILMMVNHEDKKTLLGNELIEIKRGSRVTSIRKLCERWGWSNTKVRNFLNLLEKENMITIISDSKKTTLTVVNYNDYQEQNDTKNDTRTTLKRQTNDTKTTLKHTNNNDNNDNKNIYSPVVEYLNKKTGKNFRSTSAKTRDLINARLNEGFKEKDFYKVIDIKVAEWKGNPKMEGYLRPETLFSNKFEGYLNQNPVIEDELAEIRRIMGGD